MSDRDSQDAALHNLYNDFDAVAGDSSPEKGSAKPAPQGSRRGQPAYRSAHDESQTDRRQAAQATGKKATVAGQYIRRSFTFRPDQLESIEQIAAKLGLSQNDLVRWFSDMGVEAVAQGVRPPVTEEVRHRYDPNG